MLSASPGTPLHPAILSRTRQDYIPAVRHRPLGKAITGLASHDDSVARGMRLETLKGVGQPVKQFVLMAYCHVLGHCGNDTYIHAIKEINIKMMPTKNK